MRERLYKFDNIKGVLIFLVVFGHFLELIKGYDILYLLIYSFHMPLFIFITGYFAKFNKRKFLTNMLFTYIIFQILYTYFEKYILGNESVTLTYSKPVWLLWYLFAIIVYYLLIPVIQTKSIKSKVATLLITIFIALYAGYDNSIGYVFSASRIFVFLPFFVAGFYIGQDKSVINKINKIEKSNKYGFCLLAGIVYTMIIVWILYQDIISKEMLFGSYSYENAGFTVYIRLLIMLIATGFIMLFLFAIPNKKVWILSSIGSNTMPVFLLHGFVVKYIGSNTELIGGSINFEKVLALSIVVVVLLGNKFVNKIFNTVFCLGFIKK